MRGSGELLSVELPSGHIFEVALELFHEQNHKRWTLTDTATGLKAQNREFTTRKQALEYLTNCAILEQFDKLIHQKWYKERANKLSDYILSLEV